jgi:hypothetical protein
MGCVLVTKFHIEFDTEMHDLLADEWAEELRISYEAQNVVVTEIKPKIPAGWYAIGSGTEQTIVYWSEYELMDFDYDEFMGPRVRMNPPTPYVEVGEDSKYTDGYYQTDDHIHYRRIDGEWSWSWHGTDPWFGSTYSDETIENVDDGVVFVPED